MSESIVEDCAIADGLSDGRGKKPDGRGCRQSREGLESKTKQVAAIHQRGNVETWDCGTIEKECKHGLQGKKSSTRDGWARGLK